MEVSFKLQVPSDPQMLSVVRSTVGQFAAVAGFSEDDCRMITLALDEAMTNIIRHAYNNRHDQAIEVHGRRCAEGLEFRLLDHGRSVRPAELRGRPLEEVRPGGLGTHLIAQIMDEVSYQPLEDRNELCLVKYLPGMRSQGV